jgi:hypothetical protein
MAEHTSEKIEKVNIENMRGHISDAETDVLSKIYEDYYKYKAQRDGCTDQFQGRQLESFLTTSREMFWNSVVTPSNDLSALNLSLTIGFIRKEVWDFCSQLTSNDFKAKIDGESLDMFGVKVLQAIYDKWRFKSNDKVEKFWQILYGVVNGTVCEYVGYNNAKLKRRYLREYNKSEGGYRIEEKEDYYYNDVWTEIAPLEDIYLAKTWERDVQRQGKMIWRNQMAFKDFLRDFHTFDNAEYVYPGNQIAEDSLYFRLLKGAGVTSFDQVEVLKEYDMIEDEYTIVANGIWLNPVGKGEKQERAPMPFNHKLMPFGWTIWKAIDEKFAYGMSSPFELKDYQKILNTSMTMLVEEELRAIDPPVLSSDFEAPELIYGQHKVIPVNDVNSYKIMDTKEGSSSFYNMIASLQGLMSAQAQGGTQSVAPTKQPKSSREVLQMQMMKQQALGNSLLMYYNMLRQEMLLVLKTALQFYPTNKYIGSTNDRIIRAIKIPDTSLTGGGMGVLHVRLVKSKQEDLKIFFEAIEESIKNGKMTEIIEAPIDVVRDLEFMISEIKIAPAKTSELERATWMEQVFMPAIQNFVQSGLVDPAKLYLRWLEKMGEHPADFTSDKVLPQIMSSWGQEMNFQMPDPNAKKGGEVGGQTSNLTQINTGTQNGGGGNQGGVGPGQGGAKTVLPT